ncbi:MAG: GIY-YIG nuclease family protein [Acidobacteriota bacterium]|nr:MAG: GIY-YIG nuclease family protein [Acidobacteriota bacterium]
MKGVYCLQICVRKSTRVKTGALGILRFPAGRYIYVGSAQNGLEKRLQRHLSARKTLHWHVDYLLASRNAKVERIFYLKAGKDEECKTAAALARTEEAVEGFGSSDCGCASHLFRLKSQAADVFYSGGVTDQSSRWAGFSK